MMRPRALLVILALGSWPLTLPTAVADPCVVLDPNDSLGVGVGDCQGDPANPQPDDPYDPCVDVNADTREPVVVGMGCKAIVCFFVEGATPLKCRLSIDVGIGRSP